MENKAIKILSICLVALFALAVLFFAVGLIVEYKNAPGVIDATLNQFTSDVDVASEYYTPGTQQFSDVLRARIASNKTIAVVTIAQENNVIFAYPLSSPFIVQGATGQPTVTASSSFVKIKSNEIALGNNNYIITSALYSLQPTVIYSYIRISFLVILAGTLIAGVTLMYLYLSEQKQDNNKFDDLATAKRLKNSKFDFPKVDPKASTDSVKDEDLDFSEEDNQDFDEHNLPEGAMDFPPVDDMESTEDFVFPKKNESIYPTGMMDKENKHAEVTESVPAPLHQEHPSVEFDLTEIGDIKLVVEDFDALEQEIEAFVPEYENPIAEEQVPAEHFDIDKALQGYEPPSKIIQEPQVVAPEPAYFAEPEVPADQTVAFTPEPQVVASEPAYFAEPEVVASQPEVFTPEPQVVASEPAYFAEPEVVANQPEVFTPEPQVAAPEPAYFAEPEVPVDQTVAFTPESQVVASEPAYFAEPEVPADQTVAFTPESQVVASEPAYFAEPEVPADQTVAFTPEPQVAASEPAYFAEPEVVADQTVAFTPEPQVAASEAVHLNTEPAGLFSPVTGFGWEAYLEERLDSELIRSASSEEDIGLMMIRIQGLDRTDERNKAIYDKLLDFYKFRDLIFEYGNDGFSCIVHSVNVDSALDMAEQVYVALSRILKENGMDNEIGIGISTRSFRLIPGKRIFEEAEQALIRAFTDPETAIVAFRVDPEKYRQFISTYTDEDE